MRHPWTTSIKLTANPRENVMSETSWKAKSYASKNSAMLPEF